MGLSTLHNKNRLEETITIKYFAHERRIPCTVSPFDDELLQMVKIDLELKELDENESVRIV